MVHDTGTWTIEPRLAGLANALCRCRVLQSGCPRTLTDPPRSPCAEAERIAHSLGPQQSAAASIDGTAGATRTYCAATHFKVGINTAHAHWR